MCRFARYVSHERNQIRRPGRDFPSGTRTIQHETEVTLDFGPIQVLGAFENNLLGNGKDDLDVPVRDGFGCQYSDHFQQNRQRTNVIRPKNRGAIAVEDTISQNSFLPKSWRHGIHVRHQDKRRGDKVPWDGRYQVPRVPAEPRARIVLINPQSNCLQFLGEPVCHQSFLKTQTVDGHEFCKGAYDILQVDHSSTTSLSNPSARTFGRGQIISG